MCAFPIDRRAYQRYGLRFEFTRLYLEKLKEAVAELEPTSPPTDGEIEAEIADKQAHVFEDGTKMIRVGKKLAGRTLDGKEHDFS